MRILACLGFLLVTVALAGCTQGDTGSGGGGFEATCPSWVKGPDKAYVDGNLVITNRTTLPDFDRWDLNEPTNERPGAGFGDGVTERFGHPLDFVLMDFHFHQGEGRDSRMLYVQDAELRVTFFASEGGYPGRELLASIQGRPDTAKHEWILRTDPGGFLMENVTWRVELAGAGEAPQPAGVFVHWFMIPDLDGNPDTASIALMRYSPELWYRTCSADGTKT